MLQMHVFIVYYAELIVHAFDERKLNFNVCKHVAVIRYNVSVLSLFIDVDNDKKKKNVRIEYIDV